MKSHKKQHNLLTAGLIALGVSAVTTVVGLAVNKRLAQKAYEAQGDSEETCTCGGCDCPACREAESEEPAGGEEPASPDGETE